MTPAWAPLRELSHQLREHTTDLASSVADPHAEMMAMIWGTRFDRQHALELLAKLPASTALSAQPLYSALSRIADCFDHAEPTTQQEWRRLVLRHRALSMAVGVTTDATVGATVIH
jgi:hypothetical protein